MSREFGDEIKVAPSDVTPSDGEDTNSSVQSGISSMKISVSGDSIPIQDAALPIVMFPTDSFNSRANELKKDEEVEYKVLLLLDWDNTADAFLKDKNHPAKKGFDKFLKALVRQIKNETASNPSKKIKTTIKVRLGSKSQALCDAEYNAENNKNGCAMLGMREITAGIQKIAQDKGVKIDVQLETFTLGDKIHGLARGTAFVNNSQEYGVYTTVLSQLKINELPNGDDIYRMDLSNIHMWDEKTHAAESAQSKVCVILLDDDSRYSTFNYLRSKYKEDPSYIPLNYKFIGVHFFDDGSEFSWEYKFNVVGTGTKEPEIEILKVLKRIAEYNEKLAKEAQEEKTSREELKNLFNEYKRRYQKSDDPYCESGIIELIDKSLPINLSRQFKLALDEINLFFEKLNGLKAAQNFSFIFLHIISMFKSRSDFYSSTDDDSIRADVKKITNDLYQGLLKDNPGLEEEDKTTNEIKKEADATSKPVSSDEIKDEITLQQTRDQVVTIEQITDQVVTNCTSMFQETLLKSIYKLSENNYGRFFAKLKSMCEENNGQKVHSTLVYKELIKLNKI